jgi:fucose permease
MFLGLSDNIRGPLYPEILNRFPVSNTQGSLFFALSSTASFVGGLLSHSFEKRWGLMRTLRGSVLVMLLSQLLLSLAPHFLFLLSASMVFGSSLGVLGVVTNVLVVRSQEPGPRRNKILAGLHSVYAGASLLAPVVVSAIASLNLSFPVWRAGFLFTSFFGLIVLIFTFRKQDFSLQAESTQVEIKTSSLEKSAQIFYAVMVASYVLSEVLIGSRIALYMRRESDASLLQSSWYAAGFFICLFVGRLLFTVWSPEIALKSQLSLSLLLSITCLCVGIYFHPAAFALAGFCMGPFYPMMMVSAGHLFPQAVSQALGWAVAMGSVFVVGMHFGVGFVTDHWGLKTAFYLGPAFCALSLGMLFFYEKIFRRLQRTF